MANSIRIDRDIPMTMRDGVVLRADVYRPDNSGKHPAIVVRTPYSKVMGGDSDFLSAVHAAFAGYAFVIQDTRGRFASEGEFMPGAPEGLDGYDTIEAVAAESWCDGNVGTFGGSYLGRNQWQAAIEDPPHLKAIAPQITTSGPLSDSRLGGPIDLEQSISWFTAMAIDMLERQRKQGKDVTGAREMLDRARFNLSEVYEYLPLKEVPHGMAVPNSPGKGSTCSADRGLMAVTCWPTLAVSILVRLGPVWPPLSWNGTLTSLTGTCAG